uniref:60S ribosomal export protein NMD3 n=1 Tax=Steinernema glaseri TaxID=37863 RepID=A0A1I7YUB7_9BILA
MESSAALTKHTLAAIGVTYRQDGLVQKQRTLLPQNKALYMNVDKQQQLGAEQEEPVFARLLGVRSVQEERQQTGETHLSRASHVQLLNVYRVIKAPNDVVCEKVLHCLIWKYVEVKKPLCKVYTRYVATLKILYRNDPKWFRIAKRSVRVRITLEPNCYFCAPYQCENSSLFAFTIWYLSYSCRVHCPAHTYVGFSPSSITRGHFGRYVLLGQQSACKRPKEARSRAGSSVSGRVVSGM